MTKLLRYLRSREWAVAVLALAFIVVQVWLDLKSPEYMAEITRLVQVEGSTMPEILTAGGKMLACSLGSLLAAVATAVCSSFIAAGFGFHARQDVSKGAVILYGRDRPLFHPKPHYQVDQ